LVLGFVSEFECQISDLQPGPMSTSPTIDLLPPPRPLRRRPGTWDKLLGRWFLRVFILPHTIIGLGLFLSVLFLPVQWLLGETIEGRITDLPVSHGKKTTYSVNVAYAVGNQVCTTSTNVDADVHSQLHAGQAYPVRVFAPWPHTLPVPLGPGSSLWDFTAGGRILFALFWNGLMSMFFWFVWIDPWRKYQLLKWGHVTPGIISSKQVVPGKNVSYKLTYSYQAPISRDPDGIQVDMQFFEGSMSVSKPEFNRAEFGQGVTVLYDPAKPKRSVAYEYSEHEVAT
jgi:hypothetical protein